MLEQMWFSVFYEVPAIVWDTKEEVVEISILDRLLVGINSNIFPCFYGFDTFPFQSMGVCFIGERNFEKFLLEVSHIKSIAVFMLYSAL